MINSLFMLGSSYNKNRKISLLFIVGWIAYMFIESNLSLGGAFPLINALVFLVLSIGINLVKNKKVNTILSISSILIWSVVIDTICYFRFSMLIGNQNLFEYIMQGINFNFKYIFTNILAVCAIYGLDLLIVRIHIEKEKKIQDILETTKY